LAIHFPISTLSLSNGDVDDCVDYYDDDSTMTLTCMMQVARKLSALVSVAAVSRGILSYLYYWTSSLQLYRLNFVDRMKSLVVVVVVDFVDKRYYWNLLS